MYGIRTGSQQFHKNWVTCISWLGVNGEMNPVPLFEVLCLTVEGQALVSSCSTVTQQSPIDQSNPMKFLRHKVTDRPMAMDRWAARMVWWLKIYRTG